MSYEIVYGLNFVNLGDNKFLPVMLSGSNNCTMFYGNREIRERYWSLFFDTRGITTKEEMLNSAKSSLKNHTADYEYEWFIRNGKWIVGEQIYKIIENACKNARTIEEYVEHCYQPIHLYLWGYESPESLKCKRELSRYCRTTKEILDWFEEMSSFDMGEGYSKNVGAEFSGIKPFGIRTVNESVFEKPFVVRIGNSYLTQYTDSSYTKCKDKSMAMIFTDKSEYETNVVPTLDRFRVKYSVTSADVTTTVKPFCIRALKGTYNGLYVKRRGANSVKFSSISDSMKFATRKQANKYIEEKLKGCFLNYEWEVVNSVK